MAHLMLRVGGGVLVAGVLCESWTKRGWSSGERKRIYTAAVNRVSERNQSAEALQVVVCLNVSWTRIQVR